MTLKIDRNFEEKQTFCLKNGTGELELEHEELGEVKLEQLKI